AELHIVEEQAGKVRPVGSVRLGEVGYASVLVVRDGWAYLAAGEWLGGSWTGTLRILDVRNPARARQVAAIELPQEGGQTYAVTVIGRYVYVAAYGRGQSLVVDVSDPAHPVVRGTAGV